MVELKPIKVRYAGECAKCGREIKVGWDAFFDAGTKSMYCRPCSKEIVSQEPAGQPLTEEDIASLPPAIQAKLRDSGTVKKPSLEEQLAIIASDIVNIISTVESIAAMIAANSESTSIIIGRQGDIQETVTKLLKSKEKS